ncbi:MAG TPA: triosephosphate isomerase [Candidatus Onthousia faecavium]|nr:triosephosphate isomerase [Candidatus Onthousia faecavium]
MIIALNHKSNFTKEEFLSYLTNYKALNSYNHDLLLFPSSCYFPLITNIIFGSQDVSCYQEGSYTGEISAKAIKSLGATYTLINHSERLTKLNETLDISKKKLAQALSNNLIPIICIGDTKEEHDAGTYVEKIKKDLDYLLEGIDKSKEFIIAYEPIFAIGTGLIPTNEDIEKVTTMLKDTYHKQVLYGGSANEENIETLKQLKNIDGFLLGGISLKLPSLQELLNKL